MEENLPWLCLNLIPPVLSLVGFMWLAAAREKNPDAARGLSAGLTLSLLGSLVVALPALFLGLTTTKSLGEGALFTFFLAVVGFVVWGVLLLVGYGLGYLFTSPSTPPAEKPPVTE